MSAYRTGEVVEHDVAPELRILPGRLRRPSAMGAFVVGGAVSGALLGLVGPLAGLGAIFTTIWASKTAVPRLRGDVARLIYQGRLDDAWSVVFRAASQEKDRRWKAFLVAFLGAIECQRGRFDSSLALYGEAIHHPFPEPRLELVVFAGYAEVLALAGEVDDALRVLPEHDSADPLIDWNRLVVWSRTKQYQRVIDHRGQLHRQLHRRFPFWAHRDNLLRAHAADQLGFGSAEIGRYLRRVVKPYPDCFRYLAVNWSEMDGFLRRYGDSIAIERSGELPHPVGRPILGRLGEPGGLPALSAGHPRPDGD